jgi:hypothetical protein
VLQTEYNSNVTATNNNIGTRVLQTVYDSNVTATNNNIGTRVLQTVYNSNVTATNNNIGTRVLQTTYDINKTTTDAAVTARVLQTVYDSNVTATNAAITARVLQTVYDSNVTATNAAVTARVLQTVYDSNVTATNAAVTARVLQTVYNSNVTATNNNIGTRVLQTTYDTNRIATDAAIDLKAPSASPIFSGTVTVPTYGNLVTKIADIDAAITARVLQTVYDSNVTATNSNIGTRVLQTVYDSNVTATNSNIETRVLQTTYDINKTTTDYEISIRAPRNSPTFTGNITIPRYGNLETKIAQLDTNVNNRVLQTVYNSNVTATDAAIALKAPSASPTFTGLVTASSLSVSGDIYSGSTITASNLQIIGDTTVLNTTVTTTEQFSVSNDGTGPALIVKQTGFNHIAQFYDDNNLMMILANDGKVGINTSAPTESLHVVGTVKATAFSGNNITITGTVSVPTYGNLVTKIGSIDTAVTARVLQTVYDTNKTTTDGAIALRAPINSPIFTGTATASVLNVTGKIGINTSSPIVSLTVIGTDAIQLPSGTTVQRNTLTPVSSYTGCIRYNTTTTEFEGCSGATPTWQAIGGKQWDISGADISFTTGNVSFGTGLKTTASATTLSGPFFKQGAWTTSGNSHTVTGFNGGENSTGIVYISVKSISGNKLGNIAVSFVKESGLAVDIFEINRHINSKLSILSTIVESGNIKVTTDEGCSVCWTSIGGC